LISQTYAGETYAGETPARDGRERTKAGIVILMLAGFVAAVLVIAGLIYATGASGRHKAALAAAGCEPSLFIVGLPCTTQQMVIGQYEAIVTPAGKQLHADMAAYRANDRRNLVGAEAALTAELEAVQALDNSLATVTFTPQNTARDRALITNAASTGTPVPSAAVIFPSQATPIADALVQADQALATLIAEQARSSSLRQLRSFNRRVQVADAAVQTDMEFLRKALATSITANQEP
jgi:hypothetical protein